MIKNILKGIVIGISSILPGVSGGTMAVSMGIYDKIIHCFNHFFKDFKKNLIFLFPLGIGMVISIIGSAFGLDYLFETFPIQTNLLFTGLIIGGLPTIYGKVKKITIRPGHIFCIVLLFVMIVGLALLNNQQGKTVDIDHGMLDLVKLFFVGVIAAATMVIPGVSGSLILMLLGYYGPILDAIKAFMVALIRWDMDAMIKEMFLLVPFGIGLVMGVLAIARLMEYVFEKHSIYAYWSVIGLLIASPIAIFLVGDFTKVTPFSIIAGIVMLGVGLFVAGKLGEK